MTQANVGEAATVPAGLDRSIQSGALCAQVVDQNDLNGSRDLLLAMAEVSRERLLSTSERLRALGRRTAERVASRLRERLQLEWNIPSAADLPWPLFRVLLSQLCRAVGFGSVDFDVDDESGLIRVRAWNWSASQNMEEGDSICIAIEGFATSLLEAVSPRALEAVEAASDNGVLEFVVGSRQSVRAYLESNLVSDSAGASE